MTMVGCDVGEYPRDSKWGDYKVHCSNNDIGEDSWI